MTSTGNLVISDQYVRDPAPPCPRRLKQRYSACPLGCHCLAPPQCTPKGLSFFFSCSVHALATGALQNQRVRIVNSTTKIITTLVGNSSTIYNSGGGSWGDEGPVLLAGLKNAHGISLKGGSLAEYFIADTSNYRIRVVRNGIISTLLYNSTVLDSVYGVTDDGAGSVYVTTRRPYGQVRVGWRGARSLEQREQSMCMIYYAPA